MPQVSISYFMLGLCSGAMLGVSAFIFVHLMLRKSSNVDKTSQPESVVELQECHELLLKTARRCARDLRHAADLIDRKRFGDETVDFLFDRHRHYEVVFGGTNDYRLQLHRTIELLEEEVALWKSFSEPDTQPPQ